MVTILKYKKGTIDHDIYIKVFSEGIVSYITVSTDDVLNTNNKEIAFNKLTRVFEEHFEIKVQEEFILRYKHFRIFQYPIGFSVDQTNHIMELVN